MTVIVLQSEVIQTEPGPYLDRASRSRRLSAVVTSEEPGCSNCLCTRECDTFISKSKYHRMILFFYGFRFTFRGL